MSGDQSAHDDSLIPDAVTAKQAAVAMALQDSLLEAIETGMDAERLANHAEAISAAISGLTMLTMDRPTRSALDEDLEGFADAIEGIVDRKLDEHHAPQREPV